MTIPHSNPEMCKLRIKQLLNGLTSDGYGLHLFDPAWFEEEPEGDGFKSPTVIPVPKSSRVHGKEDACADDALWLVPSIVEYVKETGEFEFLDQIVPYADEKEGTVYEHMKKILDFSEREVGSHGVCKGLRADWNDCLNLGGGESAMVTFLHVWALRHFIDLATYLGKREDAEHYTKVLAGVEKVGDEVLWDGDWYIRGITKEGDKIGTKTDTEGRVHLESNAWAVLSGAAKGEKAQKALDTIDANLYTKYGLLLNTPAYRTVNPSIGFITKVYPGLKENSSIFSHPNPWVWAAEAKVGNGDRAMKYYDALCPYYQNDMIEVRESEPYSYCQFIYGKEHERFGRARHPFMTGSGGWAYFSATRYMLGIQPDFDQLTIDPCLPKDWESFEATRVWRDATFEIQVEKSKGVMKGVKKIVLDGEEVDKIPVQAPGSKHQVRVYM